MRASFFRLPCMRRAGLALVLLLAPRGQAEGVTRYHFVNIDSRSLAGDPLPGLTVLGTPSVVDASGFVFTSNANLGRYTFADGKATLLAGPSLPPVPLHDDAKLPIRANFTALCAARDGSFLLAEERSGLYRLRPRPDGPGLTSERVPVAGDNAHPEVFAIVQRPDGLVLALGLPRPDPGGRDKDTRPVLWALRDGRLERFHTFGTGDGGPLDPRQPSLLTALADGSVLVASATEGTVLRLDPLGATSLFAGWRPQAGAEHLLHEPLLHAMAALPDGSVILITASQPGSYSKHCRLLRLRGGRCTLLAGDAEENHPYELDPDFFNPCQPAEVWGGQHLVQVLQLGSVHDLVGLAGGGLLVAESGRFHVLAPEDAFQASMAEIVKRGEEGIRQGDWKAFRRAEDDLKLLCRPVAESYRLVNKEGGALVGRRGLEGLMGQYRDLDRILAGQADLPLDRFRARMALQDLRSSVRNALEDPAVAHLEGAHPDGDGAAAAGDSQLGQTAAAAAQARLAALDAAREARKALREEYALRAALAAAIARSQATAEAAVRADAAAGAAAAAWRDALHGRQPDVPAHPGVH